jgi:hypothetical protein
LSKCFSVFIFFLVFSLFKIYICSVLFLFVTTFFHFIYLLITCLLPFLIWNFFFCFPSFFSTIFSFSKLVFNFWKIARLQEFFSLHIVEDYYMMPSMDGWRDGRRDGSMKSFISSRRPLPYKTSVCPVPKVGVWYWCPSYFVL